MIGVLLWIRNISEYKIKSNELELKNNKLKRKIEKYRNNFHSLPFPVLKYNENKKVKFYNLFYDKYINGSQRLAVASSVRNTKSGKHVLTYRNERKVFDFIKIPMRNSDGTVIYGKDVSDAEKLRAGLVI
ncbi:SANT/Myb-like DNA-binding domain-containing protein [Wolbachia endosymbiont of Atemnus politus]|uniref:hypothetical protein n=1 Tax=Wolbachia endosymbiont of Atemnus politus TaxID=2682840 RepID=UPI001FE2F820|nr:hypothetical protein [Wolbachia endosymbiont of Atemnus politus]